nr:retrovirus-related Pol polyprotein from transposon TNT 1-94 [Tanacetum cinerariifolium]
GVAKAGSTNSFNTVSNPVNATSTSGTFSTGGPSSPYPDAFIPDDTLLRVDQDDSQIPDLEDTNLERRTNHKDYENYLCACFLLHMEPKKVAQALDDENWIEAMQDELLQFSLQKVYKNKKDKRVIVVRNKARLVAQGHRQEKGIDYDEVFAPMARIEAIRIFLACASFMGFIIYQIDVKSAFLYGTIEEEVYVSQPPGFIDPRFPNKNGYRRGIIDKTLFIKMDKDDIMLVQAYVDDIIFGSTKKSLCDEFESLMHKRFQMSSMGELTFFLRLQVKQSEERIFISQDKYVAEILKKFNFSSVITASTPIETQKLLVKDKEVADVDVYLYRSMTRSLMYLTASRPDIMFSVCTCSRLQVTPKLSHLHAMKRIFRYLKGQPKLDLWYPIDSPFDLEAYSDSDYAGANLDRNSTTRGCQFLGRRLISWQCKKQTIVATSTTEAEYVAATNYYGQGCWFLWGRVGKMIGSRGEVESGWESGEKLLLNHEEEDLEIDEPQSDIVPIRRSTRTRHAPYRMCLYIDAEEHELGDLEEPANYKAALLDPESEKWLNAMNNITSRFQQNPGDIHWTIVKNILKYLRNTKDMFLVYEANESGIRKGARHFRAKVHYLREVIEFGDIKLEKVHTDDNLADPFTKALAFPKHSEHAKNIGMLPASSLM